MSRDFFAAAAARRARGRRREEAARWLVTLENAELSERVLNSWKRWESVPENRDAFDAVERVWHLADSVPELPIASAQERAADSYDGSVSISSWLANRVAEPVASPVRRVAPLALGLAAAAALVIAVILFTSSPAPDRTVVVETGRAEHKQIVFEEGTRIDLGAQTSVTASFSKNARAVALDRGEASFSVAKDPKRPFQVSAGGGTITAVGTAFNVHHRQDNEVIVSVTEGVVEVASRALGEGEAGGSDANMARLRISRGQEVTYDPTGKIGPIRLSDVTNSAAWHTGYFRYTREPLKHVIEDINRYSRLQLIIEDTVVGDLLYSGTVFTTDIKEWTAAVERTYPQVEVIATDDSHALIRSRASAKQ